MAQKRSFVHLMIGILMILGLHVLYDYKKPSCVEAQTCYTLTPQVDYFTTGMTTTWGSGQNCTILPIARSTYSNLDVNFVAVAISGHDLRFTTGPSSTVFEDHHVARAYIQILTNTIAVTGAGNDTIEFDTQVCFHDAGGGDGHRTQVWFIGYGWP